MAVLDVGDVRTVTLLCRSDADEDDDDDGDGDKDDGQRDGQHDHRALVFQTAATTSETAPAFLDVLGVSVSVC